jgi:hypothetical protein
MQGELFGQDGHENQVVDAKHHLQHDQGEEAEQGIRVRQPG